MVFFINTFFNDKSGKTLEIYSTGTKSHVLFVTEFLEPDMKRILSPENLQAVYERMDPENVITEIWSKGAFSDIEWEDLTVEHTDIRQSIVVVTLLKGKGPGFLGLLKTALRNNNQSPVADLLQ